jgi:hypothetical protein
MVKASDKLRQYRIHLIKNMNKRISGNRSEINHVIGLDVQLLTRLRSIARLEIKKFSCAGVTIYPVSQELVHQVDFYRGAFEIGGAH